MESNDIYTVAETRRWIDKKILLSGSIITKWNDIVLRKVNILVWRIRLDRLPKRKNLDQRGIDIPKHLISYL